MLKKLWRHLSVSLGFLCIIAIAGGGWYLASNHSRKNAEPVKIYRTVEPTKKDDIYTADPHLSPVSPGTENIDTLEESMPNLSKDKGPKNADPIDKADDVLEKFTQQAPDSDTSKQTDDEAARKKAEIEKKINRLKSLKRERQQVRKELGDLVARFNRAKEADDQHLYTLAEKLNAFSAEEQLAYFEDFRREKVDVEEFLNTMVFGKVRAEAETQAHSEQAEIIIDQLKQSIQPQLELSDEQRVNRYIKRLQEYGFEPKF